MSYWFDGVGKFARTWTVDKTSLKNHWRSFMLGPDELS